MTFEFFKQIFEKDEISGFIKISPVGCEFFHTDGRTEGLDEANRRFSKFGEST